MIEFHPDGWAVLGFILSTVLPLLVGLVTTRATHAGAKAVLLLALASANGLLTELASSHAQGQAYDLWAGLLAALTSFVIGVALHYGVWKPIGASGAAQDVGSGR